MNSEQPDGQSTEPVQDTETSNDNFPIVGIAASAGGLEAFTQLLKHLPIDTGMAFVLIQHLAPDHKSLLREILGRITPMPVFEVIDGMVVEPNCVYVIAPNTKMILAQGRLLLAAREKVAGKYMPADAFFSSLAAERKNKAIAIVLSGGDGDGSLALTEIKAAGGITFAQCEETAKYDSMPNTAVATGNVDFILPPDKIAEELAKLSNHAFIAQPTTELIQNSLHKEAIPRIFALLKSSGGVDFSQYKLTTIARRIERRMLLYKLEGLEDYAQYLQDNLAEIKALYEEILIHVTSFFREESAFRQLQAQVFPVISQNKSAKSPIRIWIAGCSTGEEAYSICISLLEFLGESGSYPPIQIFATDISEKAIEHARAGIYSDRQMGNVSPERLHRFFIKLDSGSYQISKAVRELCIFARQDLNSDPPFSNLDLVSCRNVLIYFGEALQKRLLPIFHYSLNPTGFLLLGNSESAGQSSGLFALIDKKHKLYSKKLVGNLPITSFTPSNYSSSIVDNLEYSRGAVDDFDLETETNRVILNRYTPVAVTIDRKMDVLQLRGETNFYLRLSPGKPSFNLFKMVREDLLIVLRATVYQAQRQNKLVRKEGLRVNDGDRAQKIINLEVIPFQDPTAQEDYFVVIFEEAIPQVIHVCDPVNPENLEQHELQQEVVRLRQELATANQERAAAHEYLQTVIHEQERINQDLKVANEEILSSNEELQSTNEELETAKEEIQSTNEELSTTNEELRSRNFELHNVNNDLTNLLASIDIPILMLTGDLRVRRFTPTAQKLLNFIPADVGRPFRDINANLDIPNLEDLIMEVINTLTSKELEVQTNAGYWYKLRIRPYRTLENRIDGAVVVLIDIDALKCNAVKLEAARSYADAIVETVQVPLLVLDAELRVNRANRAFYQKFQVSPLETTYTSIFDLGNGEWNFPELRVFLAEALNNSTPTQFEIERSFQQIGHTTIVLNAYKVQQAGNTQLLLSIEDITEQKLFALTSDRLLTTEQAARANAEVANRAKDEFLSIVSHELRNPLTSILGWTQLLRKREFNAATTTQALEIINRSVKAQVKLIEDILDVSRITTGKLQLNLQETALSPIIESAIEVSKPLAAAKNISIEYSAIAGETIQVFGDPDRLQQIIWNLLSNAIKFTPAEGRVTVTLERRDLFAQIEVSDTGQGIDADFLPHVFERFRQANSSSTRSAGGLGLGLSIVYHLVELHDGTISVASPGEGQGAAFTVQLPVLEPKVSNADSNLAPPPAIDNSILEGLRVLVVDDEEGILELLKTILEQYGAEVTAVNSAKNAIASLISHPGGYDVLLSDIGMPKEDGYALIGQVRELSAELGGQIPAAALTAYVRVIEQSEILIAGFQRHIAKPVEPEQLVLVIAELAGRTVIG